MVCYKGACSDSGLLREITVAEDWLRHRRNRMPLQRYASRFSSRLNGRASNTWENVSCRPGWRWCYQYLTMACRHLAIINGIILVHSAAEMRASVFCWDFLTFRQKERQAFVMLIEAQTGAKSGLPPERKSGRTPGRLEALGAVV